MARSKLEDRASEENPFSSSGRRKMRAYFDAKATKVSPEFVEKEASWRWMLNKGKYVAAEFLGAIKNPVPVEFNTRDELPTMLWPNAGSLLATTGDAKGESSPQRSKVNAQDIMQLMAYPEQIKQKPRERSNSVSLPSPIIEAEEQPLTTSEIRTRKEAEIATAIAKKDRNTLMHLAVSPLGLVNTKLRKEAWGILLHAEKNQNKRSKVGAHRNDRQVEKECTTAFLNYPKKLTNAKRLEKQGELAQLIKTIFQREPQLSHFQGFRDIAACFLLVMGRRRVANALQNVALFHFRDIMLGSITPVLREMEVGLRILARENSELARHLSEANVQYYYCIAWVLSWTARGVPTLSVAARIFDTFICSSPIFPVYFMTALTLSRAREILRIPKDKPAITAVVTRYPHDADTEKLLASAASLYHRHPPEKAFAAWKEEFGPNTCTQRYKDDWASIKSLKDYQTCYTRVQGYIALVRPPNSPNQPPKRFAFKKLLILVLLLIMLAAGVFVATKVEIKISLSENTTTQSDEIEPFISEMPIADTEPSQSLPQANPQRDEMPSGTTTDALPDSSPIFKLVTSKLDFLNPYFQATTTNLKFLSPYAQTTAKKLYPYIEIAREKLTPLYPYLQRAGTQLQVLLPYAKRASSQLQTLVPYAQKAGSLIQGILLTLQTAISSNSPT